jgi:urocanate hydratase
MRVDCKNIILIFSLLIRAYNIDDYPCKSKHTAAIMLMIMNNLDPRVAQV